MPKGRLVYDGDNVWIEKSWRVYSLIDWIAEEIGRIPDVIDNLTSRSTDDALSANQGRVLAEMIKDLKSVWHFLSTWDMTTWLPNTEPLEDPYTYLPWDFYIVSNVSNGWTNYKPHWATYTQWVPSTEVELETVHKNDWYLYDWQTWIRQDNGGRDITIDSALSLTSTNAVENRVITSALNDKQDIIIDLATIRSWAALWATALQPWDNITELTNNAWYQTAWDVATAIAAAVHDATLTIKKNNTTIDTFTANSSTDTVVNIPVPTTVAELDDASDYATVVYVDWEIDTIEWVISWIENDIDTLQDDVGDLKTRMTAAEWDISDLQWDVTTLQWEITEAQQDISTLEWNVATINGNILIINQDISALKANKQDKLIAGNNITINNNVISASFPGSPVTSVNGRTWDVYVTEFNPWSWTAWQILRKTWSWYKWDNESSGWWGWGWWWHVYYEWDGIDITSYVITNTKPFNPAAGWTTWQVLTKTSDWYTWANQNLRLITHETNLWTLTPWTYEIWLNDATWDATPIKLNCKWTGGEWTGYFYAWYGSTLSISEKYDRWSNLGLYYTMLSGWRIHYGYANQSNWTYRKIYLHQNDPVTLTCASNLDVDLNESLNYTLRLTSDCNMTFWQYSGHVGFTPWCVYQFLIIQDSVGWHTLTLPNNFLYANGFQRDKSAYSVSKLILDYQDWNYFASLTKFR